MRAKPERSHETDDRDVNRASVQKGRASLTTSQLTPLLGFL